MSAQMISEKMLRIALLLREATVLDESRWQAYAKRCGLQVEKGVWDVMKQNVSLGTFKDILVVDLKTIIPGKSAAEIENALASPVQLNPAQIAYILKKNVPDVATLCHQLISRNLISTQSLESALDQAEQNAANIYDVLVNNGLVTPEIVEETVADRTTSLSMDNRLLLAGDILLFNNLITREDFSHALELRSRALAPLSRILEQNGILTQEELYRALEIGLELPMVELISYDLSSELMERFPLDFMRSQLFMPLSLQDHWEIGTASPFNLALADTITLLTGRRVSVVYTPHTDILAKFEGLFPTAQSYSAPLTTMPVSGAPRAPRTLAPPPSQGQSQSDAAARVSDGDGSRRQPEPFVDNLSTVQLVTQVIESAIAARATDIHMEPQADCVRIRFRVDGHLHNVMKVPKEMEPSIVSRIKVLTRQMDVTERRRPQDGHFSLPTKGADYDFRISTLPSFHGEKIVMRILDSARVMTGLPQLGLDPDQQKTLESIVDAPYGLILVTGPTGSGKTSTLYACLSTANKESVNIITIEDPVEYQLDGITQVPVDANNDLTFSTGLRTALRQDPDIIMVGEIRDPDTAQITIRAALTGHLVFSTLHTNTAVGAFSALAHMGVPQYMIASAVTGIVAQRLVRKNCDVCKKQYSPTRLQLRSLGLPETGRKKFWKGAGCEKCFGTGYSGRTGIFEVVSMTDVLRRAVLDQASEQELAEIASRQGASLRASGIKKVLDGLTTPEEVIEAVYMG